MGRKSRIKKKSGKTRENHVGSDSRYTVIRSDRIFRILKKSWVSGILVFIASFLVYAPSLGNDFVWDDVINIEKQSYKYEQRGILKNIIPGKIENKRPGYYRPVINTSLYIDYKIWGQNPFGFHLTNNLLFSVSSLLFFFLVLVILKELHIESKEYIAAISVLIYIIHPMHVESVSWIAGRSDIICTIFFLTAFIFHILSYRNILLFPFVFLTLALSLASKEIAIVFPFFVLFYDLLKNRSFNLKKIYLSLVYFLFIALFLVVRSRKYQFIPDISSTSIDITPGNSLEFIHYLQSITVILNSYLYYFRKLVYPFNFNAFISEVPWGTHYTIASIAVSAIVAVWLFISIKYKKTVMAFGIIWVLITLAPSVMVAVLQVAVTPLAERYLFLPLCGFSILTAYLLSRFIRRKKPGLLLISLLVICTTGLYLNISRQSVWKNRAVFWDDIYAKSDSNIIAKINHGMSLFNSKKYEEGINVLEGIFSSDKKVPNNIKAIAANNIGIGYLSKNEPEVARTWFLKGVEYDTEFHKSYFHLALIDYSYAKKRNSAEHLRKAEQNLKKAIEKNRKYSRAYLMLADINYKYNNIEEARKYAEKALKFGLEEPLKQSALQILNK